MKHSSQLGFQSKTGSRLIASVVLLAAGCNVAFAQWPQWGGPNRNFTTEVKGLASKWPEEGPKKLWKRKLGDGHATIVVDNAVLYTMYRKDKDEFSIALDAKTGKTIWEHKNPSPFTEEMASYNAPGPHSTPLVVGDRLYTVGTNTVMHCFDKKTGKVLWKHDLPQEFGVSIPRFGSSSSPIAYKTMIIFPVGAEGKDILPGWDVDRKVGQSVMAFDQATGSVMWENQSFGFRYSSPIIINMDGEDQLVFFTATELVGLNPNNGELLWSHPHNTYQGANHSTPVWNGKDLIFCSAAYGSGSRVVRLTHEDGKTIPVELWYSRKMRIHHGNAIRIGDYIYGSSGDFGPAFFMAMNLKTGKIAWRKRGFRKATCVYGDGKVIILDEDGNLALATATPDGLTVHSKCTIAEPYAWAAPTLVGKKLYVRDRKHIMAFDLG